ncbi:MAG: transposase [Elusimicrobia bacterium]|nr:transposase [Elusimicrobiota bacterium]
MPRKSRELCNVGMFHVMSRCVPGLRIFERDRDKQRFLFEVARSIRKHLAEIYAYCVMSNHFHLLLCTETVDIGTVMQAPLAIVAQRWNWEHGRKGPIYDGRFTSPAVTDDRYFLNAARYIEYNPVKAGLAQRPEDYPWSSARAYLTEGGDDLTSTERLLACLSGGKDVREYAAWLRSPEPAAWPHGELPEWDGFATIEAVGAPEPDPLPAIATGIALRYGLSLEEMLGGSRRPQLVRARREFIWDAAGRGHAAVEIARVLGRSQALVSKVLAAS